MNILFLILRCPDLNLNPTGLYPDLVSEFKDAGHKVTIISSTLKDQATGLYLENDIDVLRVSVLNSEGVKNFLKKGIAFALLPSFFKKAYRRYLSDRSFDLILMPTPPITLIDFVTYVKKRTSAKFYLILRDIHPQSFNSVGLFKKIPFVYIFFNKKAQKAYNIADYIGCMSPANISFVSSIAPNISEHKIKLLPNWSKKKDFIDPSPDIRKKYGLENKFIAIFGGTIGLGQALWNIIALAKHYKNNPEIIFLVVGKGIYKEFLINESIHNSLNNITFMDYLPHNDYTDLLKTSDIGIISLHEKYRVPTCPSKIIGYMSMKVPVIAMINKESDYGEYYIDQSKCGFWSEGLNYEKFFRDFDKLYEDRTLRKMMGESGYNFFIANLTSKHAYNNIVSHIKE